MAEEILRKADGPGWYWVITNYDRRSGTTKRWTGEAKTRPAARTSMIEWKLERARLERKARALADRDADRRMGMTTNEFYERHRKHEQRALAKHRKALGLD